MSTWNLVENLRLIRTCIFFKWFDGNLLDHNIINWKLIYCNQFIWTNSYDQGWLDPNRFVLSCYELTEMCQCRQHETVAYSDAYIFVINRPRQNCQNVYESLFCSIIVVIHMIYEFQRMTSILLNCYVILLLRNSNFWNSWPCFSWLYEPRYLPR